jgi:hypothetical protein
MKLVSGIVSIETFFSRIQNPFHLTASSGRQRRMVPVKVNKYYTANIRSGQG